MKEFHASMMSTELFYLNRKVSDELFVVNNCERLLV